MQGNRACRVAATAHPNVFWDAVCLLFQHVRVETVPKVAYGTRSRSRGACAGLTERLAALGCRIVGRLDALCHSVVKAFNVDDVSGEARHQLVGYNAVIRLVEGSGAKLR